ncbi:MAG: quinol:electron acceptor oxidoreductase subunit ActD [Pirellulaceae bacterium]|nr:quinol:electron acceptor oxidoreductase subunit ActD [Pirellulaceae bacterium]
MSAKKTQPAVAEKPKSYGWMSEYVDEHSLLAASRKVRDSGYTKTDAYTPFPVHGIDEALGIKPTILPFIVLCMGFVGLAAAATMEIWMNAVSYPYIISGKPMLSIPAFIPVIFETTVLFSAFTTFFAMWGLNLLPRFSNPVFTNPRFDRVTNDRFFLHVDSRDKYFNRESVRELLAGTNPESLEEVVEDSTPSKFPTIIWMGLATLLVGSFVPATIIANMRASNDEYPRWHVFFDMDFQPKKKAQSTTTIFADGRTSRPQVPGTVARGQLEEQDPFYLGYDPTKIAGITPANKVLLVSSQDEPKAPSLDAPVEDEAAKPAKETEKANDAKKEEPATTAPAAAPAAAGPNLPWVTDFPVAVSSDMLVLGQKKFEIYCSVCHGVGGDGDGLVHRRAEQLQQGYWLPPTSLHDPRIRGQEVGNIFFTISNGKGKMANYAAVLTPKERWAVVMYIRALQRSRNADIQDVPVDQRAKIEEVKKAD